MRTCCNLWVIAGILAGGMFAGCSGDEPGGDAAQTPPAGEESVVVEFTEADKAAALSTRGFDYEFFKAACATAEGDIVVSPFSAQILLGAAGAGADEADAEAIANLLGCGDTEALWSFHQKGVQSFPAVDASTKMAIANALWYAEGRTLKTSFAQTFENVYDGGIFKVDLGSHETAAAIDRWCYEHTGGLIPSISPSISADQSEAVLANALYLKGEWAIPFDSEATAERTFHGAVADKQVSMMYHQSKHLFTSDNGYRAVRLELGNSAFAATFVLPSESVDIDEFTRSFDYNVILNAQYIPANMDLYLPKCGFDVGFDMSAALEKLGAASILDRVMVLEDSSMAGTQLRQRSVVSFNEMGAEGASVSWMGWPVESGPVTSLPQVLKMEFNRPYLFFINEISTGACLSAGRVTTL